MASKGLKGYEKAAILVMSLGEEGASQMLRNLREEDVETISSAFTRIKQVSKEQVEEVLKDFSSKLAAEDDLPVGDEDFIKRVVTGALGPDKAKGVVEKISTDSSWGMESLKWLDPKTVANFIKGEHPQTIALILSNLDNEQAGQIMTLIPEMIQPEVVFRMAMMEGVSPGAVKEIEEVLKVNFRDATVSKQKSFGGLEAVANILNIVDKATEERVLAEIETKNPAMAEGIRKLMFVFDDLALVDDKGIQALLKEINTDELGVALKSAGDEVKQTLFRNMSERAAQILQEDMEAKGPVRLADVEKAQQSILKVARNLESEGKIILGKGGEEVAY